MSSSLQTLLPPELVWGLFSRSLGVVYAIAFGSLFGQITTLSGEDGIAPIGRKLAAIQRDFPGLRRFVYFPSLLWLARGDRALRALVGLGFLGALGMVYGGPAGFIGLCAAHAVFLSLDVALRLSFPWECALFEAGAFAFFLPSTLPLPDLAATAAPPAAIAWAYRILLFRVVFGFGKFKFMGSSRRDLTYLSGFLINQPLPTIAAWYAHRLPMWALRLGVVTLFLVEIPGALLTLAPGPLGLVGGAGIVGLMVMIQLSGNFGYFNVIVAFLCLPLLDVQTPRGLDLLHAFDRGGPWFANGFVLVHTVLALFYFPFNSYAALCWHRWPFWLRLRPRWIAAPVHLARALQPLRLLHAFGVFPPKSMAAIRSVAVVEVSWDGESWHELEYTRAATRPEHRPRFVAPHMQRWDQLLIYETYGTTEHSLAYSVANWGMPYAHATFSDAECLLQRVLEGRFYAGVIFRPGSIPRQEAPKLARMRVFVLRPTTPVERRRTGAFWTRELAGPHYPARAKREDFWQLWLPEPELFDFDDVIWKRRALGRPASIPESDDVRRFFEEFLPAARADLASDWSHLPDTIAHLHERYRPLELRTFERVWGRLSLVVETRLEALYLAHEGPRLDFETHYEFALFVQHLVAQGRSVVDQVLADPASALSMRKDFTLETGMYLYAVFRLDRLVWEAHKIRLLDAALVRSSERFPGSERAEFERNLEGTAKKLWGVALLTPFLRARFTEPEFADGTPERYPRFVERETGEIVPE